MKKIKKNIFLILFLFLVILLYFTGKNYLPEVKIYQPITITITGLTNSDKKDIKINCITPFDKIYTLPVNKGIWKGNYAFYKYITIYIPEYQYDKIKDIIVCVGNYRYSYNTENFKKEWESVKSIDNQITYKSPEILRGDTSTFKMLLSVYYWGGYIRYFFILT